MDAELPDNTAVLSASAKIANHREDFAQRNHFLNTATVGVPPKRAVEALTRAVEMWSRGEGDVAAFDSAVDRSRAAFAHLTQVELSTVGIVGQASVAAGMVASSLEPGSQVLVAEEDFTSVLFPFLVGHRDSRLRVTAVPLERLTEAITQDTSLVAVSAVQSADGRVIDLDALSTTCRNLGVRTYLDVTQAAGWLPIHGGDFDVIAAGAYKWLCSPRGTGFFAINPNSQSWVRPIFAGWYSGEDPWSTVYGPPLRLASDARAYQVSPAWLGSVAAAQAMDLLDQIGTQAIYAHNLELTQTFCEAMGIPPQNSAIVSIPTDVTPEILEQSGVVAAFRDGKLRLSFHLYNDFNDLEAVLRALASSRR